MDSIEIKKKVTERGEICDQCLGRQITLKHMGVPNGEIGAALRSAETEEEVEEKIEKEDLKPRNKKNCFICEGLFLEVDDMFEKLLEKSEEIDFEGFLIGIKINDDIMENEERLWTEVPPENAEPIKRQLKREIGKRFEEETGKEANFDHPDVVFILNFDEEKIETQVKSVYIYGRYRKLERGLPQTKWPCTHCNGSGCEECDGTGQQYPYTVEGIIAKPFLEMTEGEETKFHGEGREDRDALMLGNGRPFVIESVNPHKRSLDLEKLKSKVNSSAEGKIEIGKLRFSNMEEVRELKSRRHDKAYEIWMKTRDEIKEEDLVKLEEELTNREIEQRTPTRVNHRRADKVRERRVFKVEAEKLEEKKLKARIKAEAGTYIKELVSGDYGRTRPSFAEILETKIEPEKLNVVNIDGPNND